jgi:hypothetical protein
MMRVILVPALLIALGACGADGHRQASGHSEFASAASLPVSSYYNAGAMYVPLFRHSIPIN